MSSAARRRDGSGRRWRMSKRKRQEAILAIIAKHQVATQEELVERLHRAGILTTQATVSRDIAELGLMRVAGPEGHYIKPEDGLGAASTAGREEKLRRLLRDLPLTVRRGQGIAVLTTTPGSASPSLRSSGSVPSPRAPSGPTCSMPARPSSSGSAGRRSRPAPSIRVSTRWRPRLGVP